MFLAPFGMLISKWAAMKAFVDAGHPLLLLVLVFGSSTTLFYWTKWLGKITAYIPAEKNLEEGIHGVEWLALRTLSALTIVTCVLFPVISQMAVIPYLEVTYETTMEVISRSNLLIMSMMVLLLVVLPLRFGKGQEKKLVVTNLARRGRAGDSGHGPELVYGKMVRGGKNETVRIHSLRFLPVN